MHDYLPADLALPEPAPMYFRYAQFAANTDYSAHVHPWGQLNRISVGVMKFTFAEEEWRVPADYLVWIPANVSHGAHIREAMDYQSVYLSAEVATLLPARPCQIRQSPLIRALLDDFSARSVQQAGNELDSLQARLLAAHLQSAGAEQRYLPDSRDRLLAPLLDALRQRPGDTTSLSQWAQRLYSTERTLARRFERLLGMSFVQWRQRARLLQAQVWLQQGRKVGDIAAELGYAGASTFIALFVRELGQTPQQYQRRCQHLARALP